MTDREKLIELLNHTLKAFRFDAWENSDRIADHLLANGVTVEQWIPVTEGPPENSDEVIVCHENGHVTIDAWLGDRWWYKNEVNPITHWRPFPEGPKGDKK